VLDFAESGEEIPEADIVVLTRVICCYPDMPRLAGAASDHARELLVMSFPKRTWWMRIAMLFGNAILGVTRREFHIFLHSPKSILATSEQHGLRAVLSESGVVWTVAALRRAA